MKKHITIILCLLFINNIGIAQFFVLNSYTVKNHRVINAIYSPSGEYIASTGIDRSIIVRDKHGDIIKNLLCEKYACDIAFTHDSKYLVSAGEDKNVTVWDFISGTKRFSLSGHNKAITDIAVSSNDIAVSVSTDDEIMLWDLKNGEHIKTIIPEDEEIESIAFNSDGKKFVTGTKKGIITLWETETGAVLKKIEQAGNGLKNVLFSEDDFYIIASIDNDVKFWFTQNGILEISLEDIHSQVIESIDISKDGQYILCGSYDKTFSIWSLNKAKVFKSEKQDNAVLNAHFSSDGRYIITCDYSDEIKIWDASSLKIRNKQVKDEDTNADKTPPVITVTTPGVKRGFKPVVKKKSFTVNGKITDESKIMLAFINGLELKLSSAGEFSKTITLKNGENLISIKAIDSNGNIAEDSYVVKFDDGNRNVVGKDSVEAVALGSYYALIIGVSEYSDPSIPDLQNVPVNDSETLAEILISDYTFSQENVQMLKNPTRRDILVAMDNLARSMTDEDNLLIFYAGHGYYEDENDIGYWLPSDAEQNFTANWIYNNNIVDLLKKIKTKHTLLISDACFSGSIFRGRDATFMKDASRAYVNMYKLNSRTAMTSGALKTVPNKSMFFEYLTKNLRNNTEKYMTSRELFGKLSRDVGNTTENVPQWGDIPGIGDEGGDFIFIKK